MNQAHAPAQAPAPDDACHEHTTDDGRSALPSARLLQGRNCIAIDHHGTRYVLRATRSGKLILTK